MITYSKAGIAQMSRPGAECTGCFCAALCSTRARRLEGKTLPLGVMKIAQGQGDELKQEGRLFPRLQEGFAGYKEAGRVALVPAKAPSWLAETGSSAGKYLRGWKLLLCRVITFGLPCSCQPLADSSVVYNVFSSCADTLYMYVSNVVVVAGLQYNAASSLSTH